MDDSLIKRMITSIKCGSCGQNYTEDHIEVIEHRDELWLMKVVCGSCHVRCLVAAIIREDAKPAVITDLTEAELDKFKSMESVKGEDLLAMHAFLQDFDGDFPGLFQEEQKE